MVNIGFFGEAFVVWGTPITFGTTGEYHPYICLASLTSVSMKNLQKIKEIAYAIVEYLATKIADPAEFEEVEQYYNKSKKDLELLATVSLELNESDGMASGETEFEYLFDGDACSKARQLRDILEKDLFTKGQLQTAETRHFVSRERHGGDVREDSVFRVCCWKEKDSSGLLPSSWKKEVQESRINMANIGIHGEAFVVWGKEMWSGETVYLPYIILATLRAPISMNELQRGSRGYLTEEIVRYLTMKTSDPERFIEVERSFDTLKEELADMPRAGGGWCYIL